MSQTILLTGSPQLPRARRGDSFVVNIHALGPFLEPDSRNAWMVVVSSHQHLPAWNRTEQDLKCSALIDMKLGCISFGRNANFQGWGAQPYAGLSLLKV